MSVRPILGNVSLPERFVVICPSVLHIRLKNVHGHAVADNAVMLSCLAVLTIELFARNAEKKTSFIAPFNCTKLPEQAALDALFLGLRHLICLGHQVQFTKIRGN